MRTDTLFHSLHKNGILMLANCWDAGSARIAAALPSQAIATSSAALAWAHGYADGGKLPTELLLGTVASIARATSLPLTVDIEDGYSDDPQRVASLIAALIDLGVAGVNLEDGGGTPDLLCRKIAAARLVAKQQGSQLFINARTDVYLRGLAEPGQRVAETLRRADRYEDAGASGLFVPGLVDRAEIGAIAAVTPLALNLMAMPGLPSLEQLAELGVRRLSAGTALAQALYTSLRGLGQQFMASGEIGTPPYPPLSYSELNELMS
ncbi:MAG: isocitrate lyase/phosphoenolpyruvate mutase family protein [Pseudomonadota bacterium]